MPSMIQPKLTPDQVREIRKTLAYSRRLCRREGKKNTLHKGLIPRLAKLYGVSTHTIRHIHKGERWRSLDAKPKRGGK